MHLDIVENFTKSIRNERMNWHDATGSDGCGQALRDGEGRHVSTHDVSREGRLWRTVMRRMAQIPLSGDRREPAQSITPSCG